MKKTRVCYFVGTDRDRGGAARILFNIINGLDRQRYEPLVMVSQEGPICEDFRRAGIRYRVWHTDKTERWSQRASRFARALFVLLRERVDLIHLNHGCIGWKPPELPVARLLRIPVIMHFQTLVARPSPYTAYVGMGIFCSRFASQRVTLPESLRKEVVYDVVDLHRFSTGRDLREELGLRQDVRIVAYVGRARKIKGIDQFVKLSREVSADNVVFAIAVQKAAKTPDSYDADALQALVAEGKNILLLGHRTDVENVYKTADVLVFPSRGEEPCPAVLLEAGVSGTPVVATDTGSTGEFIEHGITGFLVEKHDIGGMRMWIEELLGDEERRKEVADRAKELAKQRFSTVPVRTVERLYDSLRREH